ncbi:type II secretion system F family protein [Alkalibaculum sporogenes]|uniref:type II secretion system F family protein n=1 Tax=Alkalibaculum sporogenes TaxID=2655001 RepID=UPI00187B5926|nr:type II secretion system F family protein [Alkalibaculum sporogenes]
MITYEYIAKDKNGKTIKGTHSAESREEVLNFIRGKQFFPLKIDEQKASWNFDVNLDIVLKVKVRDLALFCRQFATTLRSGITVVDSISILRKQSSSKKLSQTLNMVYDEILKGNSLSASMAMEPKVFPFLLINMVETGEVSGNLDNVMDDMAKHFEKEYKLHQKVKGALTYPIVVSIVSVVVVVLLLTFVMPTFVKMFDSFGAELPGATKLLMTISDSIKNHWLIYLLVISISYYSLNKYIKTSSGKLTYHKFLLKMPIFGQLNNKIIMERFASTISVLLSSGVDILQAVEIVERVVGNEHIKKSLVQVRDGVRKGFGFGKTMEATGSFPPLVYQMVDVGENSGTLDFVLQKVADFYESEVETTIGQLTTLIEPLIIVVLGGIVGFIVIAMVLPIFDLYNVIG